MGQVHLTRFGFSTSTEALTRFGPTRRRNRPGDRGAGQIQETEQVVTLIRLNTLNGEVKRLIDIIEPLLAKHGVIEGSGPTDSTGSSGR